MHFLICDYFKWSITILKEITLKVILPCTCYYKTFQNKKPYSSPQKTQELIIVCFCNHEIRYHDNIKRVTLYSLILLFSTHNEGERFIIFNSCPFCSHRSRNFEAGKLTFITNISVWWYISIFIQHATFT